MTPEEQEFLTDWRAVFGEMNPDRKLEELRYTPELLALGILLRREILIRKYPASFAEGVEPRVTVKQGRKRSR